MYTRSRRSQWSLQLSLWADAVGGSARNLQRRREMGWRYREGAGQSTAVLYAAEQAERRRTMNRRKTQAITAAIVLGVTVPAWAVVNAVSTPSAHNGLAPVSDGTALGVDASGDQLAQMMSAAQRNAPALPDDGPSDSALARTLSAAHQFDLPTATQPPAVSQPAAPQRAGVPDDGSDAPGDSADAPDHDAAASAEAPADVVATPQEAGPVSDVAPPVRHSDRSEKHLRFNTHRHDAVPAQQNGASDLPTEPTATTAVADPADPAAGSGAAAAPQAPTTPSTPTGGTAARTPAKPTPVKPVATKPAPAKPTAADPAAPGAQRDPAAPGVRAEPCANTTGNIAEHGAVRERGAGETGGGASRGHGAAADGRATHGKTARSDPAAP
jgi:hypothetical protein